MGEPSAPIPAQATRPRLPAVDEVLRSDVAAAALATHGRQPTTDAVRAVLDDLRRMIRDGATPVATAEAVLRAAEAKLAAAALPSQRRVFNLTGTVLHTNLGRAILAEEAVAAVVEAMRGPTSLEYDLGGGERGERDDHVRGLVRELTGAEDCIVVNNNAAAVLLVLATHSAGRETIVSRGELIEIGGAFRIPEIMKRAGARLVEVGTTNRTHPKDFREAIGPDTGLVMKVHTSNYVVTGFTKAVDGPELAEIAHAGGVPYVEDLGSGTLVDLAKWGLPHERTVSDVLGEGADLVTFSGDKLLGGPQAGFIAGRADLVRACQKNHLKRALRLDKLRLAALEATLRLYRDPDRLAERLPTLRYFTRTRTEIRARAEALKPAFAAALGPDWTVDIVDCASQIGSGALPVDRLASAALVAAPAGRQKGRALAHLSQRLRDLSVPVIGRIAEDRLWLDLRCLDDVAGFERLLGELARGTGVEAAP
ncbi:L-seryl-tRNA(Sec) selenium transferase [Methyloraptor flagellatus]|uniref:L-seryl-tRNA(Sec) selenium transferase n=1 Tax=Methyloraptor flagellatus TaxID=3162530 RepID=A0AAU7XH45_9HYPH